MSTDKPSKIPLILALIVLGAVGYYSYTSYSDLSSINTKLAIADNTLLELEQESNEVLDDYQDAKKDYVETYDANTEKISAILPSGEDLTSLTRILDDFAFENHYDSNPFFISQMSYGSLTEQDTYRVLPISMTVEASERNFSKFLEFIETSGSLESGVRLMSVESINLQMSEDDVLRVQLSLNAYLQSA